MKRLVLGLVAMIVIASACGGAQKPNSVDAHQEIANLWTQIREWRREAHMPLDPKQTTVFSAGPHSAKEARLTCPDHHEVPRVCYDVCNLADAICDNAERICQIADELGKDDDYAQGKCASAKASCQEAKQRCCGCSKSPPLPEAR